MRTQPRILVSPLFVDKLTLTYNLSYPSSSSFSGYMRELQGDTDLSIFYRGYEFNYRGYRKAWHVALPSRTGTAPLLVLTEPFRNPSAANLSLEWNPNRYTQQQTNRLWEVLNTILLDEFESLLYEACVTRIDFAVDLTPIAPDSLLYRARDLSLSTIRTGRNGESESITFGSRKGLFFSIYNRDPITRDPVPQSGCGSTTRLEAQIRDRFSLRELRSGAIPNPFRKLFIYGAIDDSCYRRLPYKYHHFLDSIRFRGLHGALRRVRNRKTRSELENMLADFLQLDWFDAEHIWRGSHSAIEELFPNINQHIFQRMLFSNETPWRPRRRRRSPTTI